MSRHLDESSLGYILHRRAYRENSLILEVFSREHGRVALVARKRSGRKAVSPIAYEAFRRLRLRWRGRAELKTLTGLEQAGSIPLVRDRLLFGLYLNELLVRLLPKGEEESDLFDRYEETLKKLSMGEAPWVATTRFELAMLQSLGYGIEADNQDIEIDASSAASCVRIPSVSAATLTAVERDEFQDPAVLGELRELLDALLYHYLSGRRIRARALLPSPFTR